MVRCSRFFLLVFIGLSLLLLGGCHGQTQHHVVSDKSLWAYGKPQTIKEQCLSRCTKTWQDEKVRCVRLHENCSVKTVASGLKSYPQGYFLHKPDNGSVVHYVSDVTDPTTLRRRGVCAQRVQGCQKDAHQIRHACEMACG